MLIKVDISGIQPYIFDTESKGAAKSLKSRSFRVQAMGFLVADFLASRLDISPASILYQGGGTLLMLAPARKAMLLDALRSDIALGLLQQPSGVTVPVPEKLHLHVGSVAFPTSAVVEGMDKVWQDLEQDINRRRLQPFPVDMQDKVQATQVYDALFSPIAPHNITNRRYAEKAYFREVTKGGRKRHNQEKPDDESRGLNWAESIAIAAHEDTSLWQRSIAVVYNDEEKARTTKHDDVIPNPLSGFGRTLHLSGDAAGGNMLLNSPQAMLDLIEKQGVPKPFTYLVKDLPLWNTETLDRHKGLIESYRARQAKQQSNVSPYPQDDHIVEFGYLAAFASMRTGTAKLGILKMDVDDLGSLFGGRIRNGKKEASLASLASVSRAMEWFFEGYLNTILDQDVLTWHQDQQAAIADETLSNLGLLDAYHDRSRHTPGRFRDHIYPIYSGGDDCFFVGGWDVMMDFAMIVRRQFQRYCAGSIGISAGLVLVGPKFPVARFADLAEDALRAAKRHPGKNAICVMGKVFSWKDYMTARTIRDRLFYLITKKEKSESKAIIHKVIKSSLGYERLRERIVNRGKIEIPRLWRLRYYLREVKKENLDFVDTYIVQVYEKMLSDVLQGNSDSSPNLIALAGRWAELMTRNSKTELKARTNTKT
jgi:CRISPR-associated protein Csm1